MSDTANALGQRIREIRINQHMSQEELSFKAGISAAHLGQIERALKNPTIDTVAKIAGALNVPISSLFTEGCPAAPPPSTTVSKINAYLADMDDAQLRDVLRMIRIFRRYLTKD